MLAALGTVVVTSLSGVMMPGPMFTMTLAKSYKSPWAGVHVSLGHAVIEVPLILLVYFGLGRFFENSIVQLVLSERLPNPAMGKHTVAELRDAFVERRMRSIRTRGPGSSD